MKTRTLILLFCCAALVPLLYAAYPDEYPIYLGTLGFSKTEITHLQDGGLISHSLYDRLPGEYGIVSAIVQNVPVYYFRDYYQYIENFKSLNEFAEVGKFKNTPSLQDLMALSFSDAELLDFLNCRSGHCTVQLSTEEIATIPANGSLQTEVGKAEVANAYRKILLDRLLAYQKGGTAALASYVGSPEPQNLMDNLQEHLYKFPYLHAYFPRVEKMILDYPAYRDPGTRDFYYWSRDHLGTTKPVITVRHVMIIFIGEDYVVVNKLVYSNHYFLSSLGIINLINYANKTIPRTLLVYDQRTLTDLSGDAGKAFGRNILRSNLEKRVAQGFESTTQAIQVRYVSRWYNNFPFGLLPRDER